LTFRQALEMLAERAGVELPAYQQNQTDSHARLFEANAAAAAWFATQLQQSESTLAYLAERGLAAETITQFHRDTRRKLAQS
jgi:DNA primase